MFVEISHKLLIELADSGYNVLTSTSQWGDESPTYMPGRVENIDEYINCELLRGNMRENQHFLVIAEALEIPEEQLFGVVWVD